MGDVKGAHTGRKRREEVGRKGAAEQGIFATLSVVTAWQTAEGVLESHGSTDGNPSGK